MTRDQREILEFARIWAPYGGAQPADIFVLYGMSPAKFYHIIRPLLRTVHARMLMRSQNAAAVALRSSPNSSE